MRPCIVRSDNISRSSPGFTLLEVLAALALLVAMSAGVFSLANGTLQLSVELRENRREQFRTERFDAALRHLLTSLPGNCRFELFSGETTDTGQAELRWWLRVDEPNADIDQLQPLTRLVARPLKPDGVGRDTIYVIEQVDESDAGGGLSAKRYSLLDQVSSVHWRLFDTLYQDWTSVWEESQGRPRFIEIEVRFGDARTPFRSVYWIPPTANPADLAAGLSRPQPAQPNLPGARDSQPLPSASPGTGSPATPRAP